MHENPKNQGVNPTDRPEQDFADLSECRGPKIFTSFQQLEEIERERLSLLGNLSVHPGLFSSAGPMVDPAVELMQLGGPQLSEEATRMLTAHGKLFRAECAGSDVPLAQAFTTMREPVEVHIGEKVVQGIPLFGQLDPDNVDPIARGVALGLKQSLASSDNTPIHLVDIGTGWGGTGTISLHAIKAAVQQLENEGRDIPNITLHTVDPRLDVGNPLVQMSYKEGGPVRFENHHPDSEGPLPISTQSAPYLPKTVPIGFHLSHELESNSALRSFLADHPQIKIIAHRATSDEFFASNSDSLQMGKVAVVVVDGEHGINTDKNGAQQLQPLMDIHHSVEMLNAEVIVTDDNKDSAPCCGVAAAFKHCAQAAGGEQWADNREEPTLVAAAARFANLATDGQGHSDLLEPAHSTADIEQYAVIVTKNSRTGFLVKTS
jgi:hypothetical protein